MPTEIKLLDNSPLTTDELSNSQLVDLDFLQEYLTEVRIKPLRETDLLTIAQAHAPKVQKVLTEPDLSLPDWLVEKYRILKANLSGRQTEKEVKTLLLVSALPGEGCSTILADFAKVLSQLGKQRVLLLDANFSNPSLHKLFDLPGEIGLCEIVEKRVGLSTALKGTRFPNLSLVTRGHSDTKLTSIMESDRLRETIAILREEFDYLLIDTASLSRSSDATLLSRIVDGVVLVLQAHRTRWEVALAAKKQLQEAGANILGVVLNRRKLVIPERLYRRL